MEMVGQVEAMERVNGPGRARLDRWTFRSFSHGFVESRSSSCWQDRRVPRWGGGKGSST